jgi:TolB-like protein
MPSIIENYSYDIFISYRQKDNKGGMWVSEFVDSLKDELESTFKEEITVYFDINPHDGLLETHDVNASLKEKLKCLIFIPIISQTYCDSKSFAWQNEFVPFNKLASEDRFGRDIRLAGGNVTSRILPVKIHDLDQEDKALLESELGGVLRSIEFIYKSPGVNRPLRASEDHPQDNLNKTYYRDQINKVANTVKEIITAIRKQGQPVGDVTNKVSKIRISPPKKLRSKIILGSFILLVLILSGYFFIPGISDFSAPLEKTIAVLPFRNLSNDPAQVYFCDGFMDEILNNLQRVKEFTVRSRTSTDHYRETTRTTEAIGKEMNVNYLIEGSVARDDNNLKIWVNLINVKTNKSIWSNDYPREMKQIFLLQSEIAKEIAVELKTVLSPEEIIQIDKKPTKDLNAYNYYLQGNAFSLRSFAKQDFEIAIKMYEKAIESDPDFALAYVRISICYLSLHWFHYVPGIDRLTKGKEAIDAAFKIDPALPEAHLALSIYYYWGFLNYSKALQEVDIAMQKLNNSECYYTKATIYLRAGEFSLSKENQIKAFALDPGIPRISHNLAVTFSLLREYAEAEKYFKNALLLNPTFIEAVWQKSYNYMKWKGNTNQARETISEAFQFRECVSNPLLFESSVLMDIYDSNYQKALSYLSTQDINYIYVQFYINLKSLLYARIFKLMNMPEKANKYFNYARITLDSLILKDPGDSRLYSAIGIAYAGLGQKEKAIEAGEKGVIMMPISKEAYRGVFRVEDMARIYVIVGEYDKALELIKQLLKIPSRLSVKMLLMDPDWKPLWNLPEFKKIINSASAGV